jgi:murein DD-endopeptidase MepM/ murein hydrolase activator NlpD
MVQDAEDFGRGGAPPVLEKNNRNDWLKFNITRSQNPMLTDAYEKAKSTAPGSAEWDDFINISDEYGFLDFAEKEMAAANKLSPMQQYRLFAGEAEARAVQARINMSAEQRRAVYPFDSYDVPVNELIHQTNGGRAMSVTAPQPGLLGKMVAPQDEALRVAQALPDTRPMKRDFRKEIADRFQAETGTDINTAGIALGGVDVRNLQREHLRTTFAPYMGGTKEETIARAQAALGNLSGGEKIDLIRAIDNYKRNPFDSLDPEPYPYSPEQMKAFSDWQDYGTRSSNYAYHGTDASSLEGIRQQGLLANPPMRRQDMSKKDKVYLSANQRTARRYADGYSGNGAILRVKTSALTGQLEPDHFEDAAYAYGDNIPPELIEMKVGKKWVPLK